MSRRMVSILATAAAAFAIGAPTASAADAVALPYCWGATYGGTTAQICAENTSWISGTVVDPGARTDCIIKTDLVATSAAIAPIVIPHPCQIAGNVVTGVDDTGARLGGVASPYVYGLSVRIDENRWATLYVDGTTYGIITKSLCVGGGCPTTNYLQLVQVTS